MKAETLSKYLNKVKRFAWENGPSPMYSNVLIHGSKKSLLLSCTDGNTGIQQVIEQDETPIICECCANVFKLSNIIDEIKKDADISFKVKNNKIEISDIGKKIKLHTPSFDKDQILNIPICNRWNSISLDLIKVIQSVMPVSDDSDAPIISDGKQIFHANPKAVYYRPYKNSAAIFSIDNKFIKRIFIDTFTSIAKLDGHLFLNNDNCTIHIPLFNGKQLMLEPVIKSIEQDYIINCKVGVQELSYGYGIIKQIAEQNEKQEVILDVCYDHFKIELLDSSYSLMDYIFKEDYKFKIKIPPSKATPEAFDSVNKIVSLVSQYLK